MPTRILRDQLGEKLAKSAGVDFSAPIVEPKPEPKPDRSPLPPRGEPGPRGAKDKSKPEKRPVWSKEKRLPGRPLRGEGRRDTFDARDESPTRPAKPGTLPRKRGRDKPRGR